MRYSFFPAFSLLLAAASFARGDSWQMHPDAAEQSSVPHGKVYKMEPWRSKIFSGTVREWSVYVPAQLQAGQEAAVMVFQDGHDYVRSNGHWRVPAVFDNLIARGDMPPTIAIFLDPGRDAAQPPPASPWKASNRSLEYDSLGDRYARFLLEEIFPEVEKRWKLSHKPEQRALCGASSGAICAFTAAWEHPESFQKVLSTIGSFVNLRGGNVYPSLIRKTERKPLRVFLQDSSGDLDNAYGNWPIANKQMAAALRYMGYDVRFDFAEGYGHNSDHGGSIFPEALKWLWRPEQPAPPTDTTGDLKGDLTLLNLLLPGEGWRLVAEGLGFADAAASDEDGNFYFSDMKSPGIYKIGVDASRTKLASEGASGLKIGPDGWLYACQAAQKRVIAIHTLERTVREVAVGVQPNDLAITKEGYIYITETEARQITFIDSNTGATWIADYGIAAPNGIAISPDGGTLAVSEFKGQFVWAFRLEADGTLTAKQPYMTLRLPLDPNGASKFGEPPPTSPWAKGDGMSTDWRGRYYVSSALGVQVFDPTGRFCGLLEKPQSSAPLTSCTVAGRQRDTLFVTNGDKIFSRKLQIETPKR